MVRDQVQLNAMFDLPLPLENQKREVMTGLTNASNTCATGLRMSILLTGGVMSFAISCLPLLVSTMQSRCDRGPLIARLSSNQDVDG